MARIAAVGNETCKDGGATNAAGGGNSCGTESFTGQFQQPGEGSGVLRKQLRPGTSWCVSVMFNNIPGMLAGTGRLECGRDGMTVPASFRGPLAFVWQTEVVQNCSLNAGLS